MSNGDPIGSDKPRGKSNAARKGRYDGAYTGTEARLKNELMRQFMKTHEGELPSEAYRNAPCWCACGRLKAEGFGICERCLRAAMELQDDGGPQASDLHPELLRMLPKVPK